MTVDDFKDDPTLFPSDSSLRKLFKVCKVPVSRAEDLVPIIENLLIRFDALPEWMHPDHNSFGKWDIKNYWMTLVQQIETMREALMELKSLNRG